MQWWCSAQTAAWAWRWQPYPGVWIFIALLAVGYFALQRGVRSEMRGPRLAAFVAGAAALWVALDWPLGALGAGYLASAHMIQFLLIALIAPPALLFSLSPVAYQRLASVRPLLGLLRVLTQPLLALVLFNLVVAATHWPPIVDRLMPTQLGSFAIDMSWLLAGLLFWWPLVAPLPERPGFPPWMRVGYLIVATILSTPVFAYLTFSHLPLYSTYELAPPIRGLPTRVDQQVAGLLMKIGGGLILWAAITVIFFRWYWTEEGGRQEKSDDTRH